MAKDREEFYRGLKEKLNEQTQWPTIYLFKFIVPADNQKHAQVVELFGDGVQITTRTSAKGNFISISAKEVMMDAESIIAIYKRAESIEGLIAL
jgi:putative lipoic acid-binding regulatory protein